jgi:VanZ family protein
VLARSVSPHSGGTVPDSHRVPSPPSVSARPYHGRVPATRLVSLWLPVVAWAALIFLLSAIPSLNSGLGTWDTVLRKAAHVTEYAVLGVLLWRALGAELPALAAAVGYAISDEIHQTFVRGRHGSPVDVAIDTAGVLLGLAVLRRARTA